jgi:uncharacterized membrane protein YcaP (DUF421 family)
MIHTLASLAIVVASTAGIYLFLILILRLFGRRQLGQLTVIDLIVVLVLGSAVETAMIHGDLSLPAGLTSAATLLVVNRLLTWVFLRSSRLRNLVGGGPILLVENGSLIHDHLRRAGLTSADVAEALRGRGYEDLSDVKFAVLETDGEVTVVPIDRPAKS